MKLLLSKHISPMASKPLRVMDVEVPIPLDKPFAPPAGCVCKPGILLTNAVTIRHIGLRLK